MCRRENYREESALARWFHDWHVVIVATRSGWRFVSGRILLVATVALGAGDSPVLSTVHREPLILRDYSLAHRRANEALPSAGHAGIEMTGHYFDVADLGCPACNELRASDKPPAGGSSSA